MDFVIVLLVLYAVLLVAKYRGGFDGGWKKLAIYPYVLVISALVTITVLIVISVLGVLGAAVFLANSVISYAQDKPQ